ncbi:MAG TPA: hypothetical protein VGI20_14915 [Rhizomicrobium sp.]
MRAHLMAFAIVLLPSGLMAQETATAPAQPDTASQAAQTNPATAAGKMRTVVCEYQSHEGRVIPLRQCVSAHEAEFRRSEQQRIILEIQQRGLTVNEH